MLMVLVVTCNCGFAGTIERIEGNRPLRVGKIRRNRATIALTKFFPTSSRVPAGFNGLPCSGSGRSEKRPSMIHGGAFFGYFFIFLAPTVRLPLFKCAWHTHTHTHKFGLIFSSIENDVMVIVRKIESPQGHKWDQTILFELKWILTQVFWRTGVAFLGHQQSPKTSAPNVHSHFRYKGKFLNLYHFLNVK